MHEKLKKFFEDKGLNQTQIAEKLGVSVPYVNAVLNGTKTLGKKNAEKWANLFGLSKSFLLTGEGDIKDSNKQQKITDRANDIQMAVLGHVVSEQKRSEGIASEEDIRPFIPTWADTLISILSKQIAENEVLHAELQQSISDVQVLKKQLAQIIEKIR